MFQKSIHRFLKPSSMRIVVFGFLLLIFAGAFLLSLPIAHRDGGWYSFSDALFTSTSAVCVTGLVVADTAAEFTLFGQIVILLLIQAGGLGFMTGAVLIFMILGKRITLQQRLLVKESISHYKLQGVVALIRQVLLFTAVIEGAGAFVLAFEFVPAYGFWSGLFKSIFLSVSAFYNAGFDVLGTGEMIGLNNYVGNVLVCLSVMFLIVLGGLGFTVLMQVFGRFRGHRMQLPLHTKIVLITTAVLIVSGGLLFTAFEWNHAFADLSPGEKFLAGFFQSVTPRTAGFNTVNQADLSDPSLILTTLLMFIGASPASTGGGIKTTTFVMLLLVIYSSLSSKKFVTIDRKTISGDIIRKSLTIVTIALVYISLATLLLSVFEADNPHADLMTVENFVFETVSAMSTVGLSRGITPYLCDASKLILELGMFIGRVGALTLGVAIVRRHTAEDRVQYADAKILIG